MDTRIEADLRDWSRRVLEVPNDALGGLPPCPYARKAWRENKVLVIESDHIYSDAKKFCAGFRDLDKELIIVASYSIPDLSEFHEFVDQINEQFPSLHCMEFHPDYDAEDAELDFLTDNDWESSIEQDYCMIFIQDLALVVDASDRLKSLGYYAAYPKDEYQALVVDRKRRLSNGHEATSNEESNRHEARRED